MDSYINKVVVKKETEAADTAKVIASAVQKALGWVLDNDGVTVWMSTKKELGVRFKNDSGIYPCIVNAYGTTGEYQGCSVGFTNTSTVTIYWLKTALGTICLGITDQHTVIPTLSVLFGKNENGTYVGVTMGSSVSDGFSIRSIGADEAITMRLVTNYALNLPVTLIKMPDILHGGVFSDVYMILTTPANISSTILYVSGRYYRVVRKIGDTSGVTPTLAIPVD